MNYIVLSYDGLNALTLHCGRPVQDGGPTSRQRQEAVAVDAASTLHYVYAGDCLISGNPARSSTATFSGQIETRLCV